jgi:DNA-binding transcriptional ArsR family regulator
MPILDVAKAVANDRRLMILHWLKKPRAHFRRQADGDLVHDGVCGLLIAQKLGVSQPTASEHLKILTRAGLLRTKRIKQWTFYRRDERRIAEIKAALQAAL